MCSAHQSHLLKGWAFGDGGWWCSPSDFALQERAFSSTHQILPQENTRLDNPPLYAPCVAWFCFSLCKITVVQVFRRRRHVDGLARKRTAKHLCSPQRSFLSYNRLSCPEWIFGFTARPSSVSRLQRTVEGAFQDDRLSLSKGRGCTRLVDSSASREIATGTWTGQTGRKRREAARRKAVERRGLESMPGRRWAAL